MTDEVSAAEYAALAGAGTRRGRPEEAFQAFVVDLARANGWRVQFVPDWVHRLIRADMARRRRRREWPDRGFPDPVLCRPPQLLVVELKSATGSPTPEQREWIAALRESGTEVRTWRPNNEAEIRETLERQTA